MEVGWPRDLSNLQHRACPARERLREPELTREGATTGQGGRPAPCGELHRIGERLYPGQREREAGCEGITRAVRIDA